MSNLPPPPSSNPTGVRTSGAPPIASVALKYRRFAGLIDGVIFLVCVMALLSRTSGDDAGIMFDSAIGGLYAAAALAGAGEAIQYAFIPFVIVLTLFIPWRASPGKTILGFRVVDSRTGRPASLLQMAWREWVCKVGLIVLTGGWSLVVSAMMSRFNPTERSLWDVLSRTSVVEKN